MGQTHEAAWRDVLRVISESHDDEQPVFEAILERSAALCRAPMAWLLLLSDGGTQLTLAAYHGSSRRALEIGQTWDVDMTLEMTGLGRAMSGGRVVQDEDLTQAAAYRDGSADMVQLVDDEGLRTRVSVPLMRDDACLGAIVLSRREVAPFSEDEIALTETFATQAVIAINKVQQFREVQTRLQREAGP